MELGRIRHSLISCVFVPSGIALGALTATAVRADNAASAPAPEASPKPSDPFAFADFSWVPGNYAPAESPLASKYFTPEIRIDTAYDYSFNHPADDTISGSSEVFRHAEFQLTQLGLGGDFNYDNVTARVMTQFGMYSQTTPRNDASAARGQWNLTGAYQYLSEAYGGYHIDALNGINIQVGLFLSYIGLWSYYNFDNWTYQPSYVSSNTPWFFNGARVQIFTSDKLKIEPWLINGWQAYGRYNNIPGIGGQVLWAPNGWFSVVANQYFGSDDFGDPDRRRVHTDESVMLKYHDAPDLAVSKAAVSLTMDAGCEYGGQVSCGSQYFLGFMAYNRLWLLHDHFAFTFGGGAITNPGRYLVLLPPIDGATAVSGSYYFPENPGDDFHAWDTQLTADWMPTRNLTFRLEFNHRQASVPYFSGPGGVTPPGGNNGVPQNQVQGWQPDLSTVENRVTGAMMVRI